MTDVAVRFQNVSKRFRKNAGSESLVELVRHLWRKLWPHDQFATTDQTFWALRDIDFEVQQGEAFGIVGPNGAGKSTALKLLARILRPDHGEIHVQGRLTALIEVGAGFHGELTGRENIYLNGAILGMARAEIRRKLDDIVAFAGIESFLDMPVKRYSSGMYARLGFSIAAHVDPDVLLVDEVLSVGDAVFRLRCLDRMKSLINNGTALVFVTHQLEQMQAICNRALVLEQGRCTFLGPTQTAIDHYLRAMSNTWTQRPTDLREDATPESTQCEVLAVRLLDDHNHETVRIRARDPLQIEIQLRFAAAVPRLVIELNLRGVAHQHLLSLNSARSQMEFSAVRGDQAITLSLPELPLAGGQYFWNVRAWNADTGTTILDTPFRYPMIIDDQGRATGALCLDHVWSHSTGSESPIVEKDKRSVPAFTAPKPTDRVPTTDEIGSSTTPEKLFALPIRRRATE